MENCDVRMLQAGVNFDFAQKAVGKLSVFIEIGEDDLHCLLAVRNQVAHPENLTHAAAAQNAGNPIMAEDIADLNGHQFVCNANCGRRGGPQPDGGKSEPLLRGPGRFHQGPVVEKRHRTLPETGRRSSCAISCRRRRDRLRKAYPD